MADRVLVAYASKHGATAEIAEKIGQALRQAGLEADVSAAKSVKDMRPYTAYVLGSAVYIGQWRKEAVGLVKANVSLLAQRPVWLFSTGPTGKGNPEDLTRGWKLPKRLTAFVERIKPRDVALFHGAIDQAKLGSIERFLIKNVKAEVGDFRDFEAVDSWANSIAVALKHSPIPT